MSVKGKDGFKENNNVKFLKPLVIINFKLYPEAVGKKSSVLAAQFSNEFSKEYSKRSLNYSIAISPPTTMLGKIRELTSLSLFAQHADAVPLGAYTGHLSPEELKLINIQGAILNHSEKKILDFQKLRKTIKLCRKYQRITVVCASSPAEIKKIAKLHPDYLAYEPPVLIGGNISVTKAKPEIITEAVAIVHKISPKTTVLCGAGIHSNKDLNKALQLGASGVLIGHAIAKAKDPLKRLKEILKI